METQVNDATSEAADDVDTAVDEGNKDPSKTGGNKKEETDNKSISDKEPKSISKEGIKDKQNSNDGKSIFSL